MKGPESNEGVSKTPAKEKKILSQDEVERLLTGMGEVKKEGGETLLPKALSKENVDRVGVLHNVIKWHAEKKNKGKVSKDTLNEFEALTGKKWTKSFVFGDWEKTVEVEKGNEGGNKDSVETRNNEEKSNVKPQSDSEVGTEEGGAEKEIENEEEAREIIKATRYWVTDDGAVIFDSKEDSFSGSAGESFVEEKIKVVSVSEHEIILEYENGAHFILYPTENKSGEEDSIDSKEARKRREIVFPEGVGGLGLGDTATVYGKYEGDFTLKKIVKIDDETDSLYFLNENGVDFQVLRKKGAVSNGEDRFQSGADKKLIEKEEDKSDEGTDKDTPDPEGAEGVDPDSPETEERKSREELEKILKDKREVLAEEYSKLKEKTFGVFGSEEVEDEESARRIAYLENEYRDSLKAYRAELFASNPDEAEEIIKKTVVDEAIKFENLKVDFRLNKTGFFETYKAVVGKVMEGYTRIPKKYKYTLSALLFGASATAGVVGGATGDAVLTGVFVGRGIQRAFSTTATMIGVEAWRKAKQEKKEAEDAIDSFSGLTVDALNKKSATLDKMLFELEGSKKAKKYKRFGLAGAAGVLIGSGVIGKAIGWAGGNILDSDYIKDVKASSRFDTDRVPAVDSLEYESQTKAQDVKSVKTPIESSTESPESMLNENTIVKEGDGIETVLIRQLRDSPYKFGYEGSDDAGAIKKWAGERAHRLAKMNGFFDEETGRETWIRYDKDNPIHYVLKEDGTIDSVNSDGNEYDNPEPYHGTLEGESTTVEEVVSPSVEEKSEPMIITENPDAEGVKLKNEITVTRGDDEFVIRVFGEKGEPFHVNEPGSNEVIDSTTPDEARIYDKDGNLLGIIDRDVRGMSAEEMSQKAKEQMDVAEQVESDKIAEVKDAEITANEKQKAFEEAAEDRFEAGKALRTNYPHFSMDTTNIILDLNEYTSDAFSTEMLAQQFDSVIGENEDKFFKGIKMVGYGDNNVKIEFIHKANLGTVDMLFNGTDGTVAVDGFGGENLSAKEATPYSLANAFRFISSGAASRDFTPLQKAIMEQEARDDVVSGFKGAGRGIKNFLKFLFYRK